ncbi:MAG: hypothetical protein JWM88_1859 [Verrucomicrobia bacterium]|nr:hypothetical protein [Verrucomicrobiota bacterium]
MHHLYNSHASGQRRRNQPSGNFQSQGSFREGGRREQGNGSDNRRDRDDGNRYSGSRDPRYSYSGVGQDRGFNSREWGNDSWRSPGRPSNRDFGNGPDSRYRGDSSYGPGRGQQENRYRETGNWSGSRNQDERDFRGRENDSRQNWSSQSDRDMDYRNYPSGGNQGGFDDRRQRDWEREERQNSGMGGSGHFHGESQDREDDEAFRQSYRNEDGNQREGHENRYAGGGDERRFQSGDDQGRSFQNRGSQSDWNYDRGGDEYSYRGDPGSRERRDGGRGYSPSRSSSHDRGYNPNDY